MCACFSRSEDEEDGQFTEADLGFVPENLYRETRTDLRRRGTLRRSPLA